MDFQIVNNKGVYEIHGDFTTTNTNEVAFYFSNLLDKYYEIVICLKKVRKFESRHKKIRGFSSAQAAKIKIILALQRSNITEHRVQRSNITECIEIRGYVSSCTGYKVKIN